MSQEFGVRYGLSSWSDLRVTLSVSTVSVFVDDTMRTKRIEPKTKEAATKLIVQYTAAIGIAAIGANGLSAE